MSTRTALLLLALTLGLVASRSYWADLPLAQRADQEHEIREIVQALAPQYGLDPHLVMAVIKVESNFRPDAVSGRKAKGLMQLIPATAQRFGVEDPLDPHQNIAGGMRYLQWLFKRFNGKLPLVLAAYNSGENTVRRYKGIPPYRETRAYVRKVQKHYDALRAQQT